ncbi:phosphate ABC transporter permease subunit PstC [Lamprocystis purpurea]|jgi:phosphate transport system permease protein|uniref:phosphate ABC transporter permease subunit PstC n=1 Tax=Lamprocystis purpurea TaxID=61598 RepID=UPI00037C736D|nr:phosphate ABC transporter permease subunit PstC [Lamprocystis purpurea]
MHTWTLLVALLAAAALAYHVGRKRAIATAGGSGRINTLHSLPAYYGFYAAMWAAIPALLLLGLWLGVQDQVITTLVKASLPPQSVAELTPGALGLLMNDVKNVASGNIASGAVTPAIQTAADHYARLQHLARWTQWLLVLAISVAGMSFAWSQTRPTMRARNRVESVVLGVLILFSSIAVLTTLGIVLSVVFESWQFFQKIAPSEFFLGTLWSPQTAMRADQVAADGAFGAVPLFTGTLLVSFIAMMVAVPIGLMAAIYLSEYAPRKVRSVAKPLLEILAGIPTVVYGFFAALTLAPVIRDLGEQLGFAVASESALAAGLVMGIMIIPFVSSLSDDVINAVPQAMRDGSYALGATQSETIRRVVIPAALPGIVGGVLLAVSRAIGETMIVVMAAGLTANLTANPLASVTTVTVQIVTLLTGDQEFDSAKTLAAFALGLTLFLVTLTLNIIALHIVRKYREQYE